MQSLITFPAPVSEEESMPLRKEHTEAIAAEVTRQLNEAIDDFRPHGWRKVTHFLREWGISGTIVMAFVALMGITLGALYYSFSNVKEETTFRVRTGQRLDSIEAALLELRAAQSPAPVLKEISNLSPEQFVKALPALRRVAEQPPSNVQPVQSVLQDVARKLLGVNPLTPDYWPTVLRFIQFASAGLSPDVPRHGPPTLYASQNKGLSLGVISRAVVQLDGGELVNTRFEHSRIIFTNDPVLMRNVTFSDCVFELPISDRPIPYVQQAARRILASSLNSIVIGDLRAPG